MNKQEKKDFCSLTVLVLGVGGNVSQGIIKALKMSGLDCKIIGACISADSPGLYLCDKAYISPFAASFDFMQWLIDVCNKDAVDIVLTGVEENIIKIAQNYDEFTKKTNAIFKCTDYNKLLIGQDKFLTCNWLKENNCNYPEYCKSEDKQEIENLVKKVGFPLIAKPRHGKGSHGIIIINNSSELTKLDNLKDYVVQECVGTSKDEYTVGCYCDKTGNIVDTIIMHRDLKQGTTYKAQVIKNDVIQNEAKKICKSFKPVGPINIQMRLSKTGRPVCFELNVRFSGTTPMRAHFGFNDVEAMIKEYIFEQDITNLFNVKTGIAYRYLEEVYTTEEITRKLIKYKTVDL